MADQKVITDEQKGSNAMSSTSAASKKGETVGVNEANGVTNNGKLTYSVAEYFGSEYPGLEIDDYKPTQQEIISFEIDSTGFLPKMTLHLKTVHQLKISQDVFGPDLNICKVFISQDKNFIRSVRADFKMLTIQTLGISQEHGQKLYDCIVYGELNVPFLNNTSEAINDLVKAEAQNDAAKKAAAAAAKNDLKSVENFKNSSVYQNIAEDLQNQNQYIKDVSVNSTGIVLTVVNEQTNVETIFTVDQTKAEKLEEVAQGKYDEVAATYASDVNNFTAPTSTSAESTADPAQTSSAAIPAATKATGVFNAGAAASQIMNVITTKFNDSGTKVIGSKAATESNHHCAMHVRMGLAAGGINVSDRPSYARQYISWLPKKGFQFIGQSNSTPQIGDVAAYPNPSDPTGAGHICMYTGFAWASDYLQKSERAYPGCVPNFFRYTGQVSTTGAPTGTAPTGSATATTGAATSAVSAIEQGPPIQLHTDTGELAFNMSSRDALKHLAKLSKLGYCVSDVADTNDWHSWQFKPDGVRNVADFIQEIAAHAYGAPDGFKKFYQTWVDINYDLVFLEVNAILGLDGPDEGIDITKFVNQIQSNIDNNNVTDNETPDSSRLTTKILNNLDKSDTAVTGYSIIEYNVKNCSAEVAKQIGIARNHIYQVENAGLTSLANANKEAQLQAQLQATQESLAAAQAPQNGVQTTTGSTQTTTPAQTPAATQTQTPAVTPTPDLTNSLALPNTEDNATNVVSTHSFTNNYVIAVNKWKLAHHYYVRLGSGLNIDNPPSEMPEYETMNLSKTVVSENKSVKSTNDTSTENLTGNNLSSSGNVSLSYYVAEEHNMLNNMQLKKQYIEVTTFGANLSVMKGEKIPMLVVKKDPLNVVLGNKNSDNEAEAASELSSEQHIDAADEEIISSGAMDKLDLTACGWFLVSGMKWRYDIMNSHTGADANLWTTTFVLTRREWPIPESNISLTSKELQNFGFVNNTNADSSLHKTTKQTEPKIIEDSDSTDYLDILKQSATSASKTSSQTKKENSDKKTSETVVHVPFNSGKSKVSHT